MNLISNFDAIDKAVQKVRDELDSDMEQTVRKICPTDNSLAEALFSDLTLFMIVPPIIEQTGNTFILKEKYKFDWPSDGYLTIEDEIWEDLDAL